MTSPGMPMSAMTMSPARVSAGGSTSGSFGARERDGHAGLDAVADRLVASRPTGPTAGRSTTTGMPEPLTSATTVSSRPDSGRVQAGAEDRVDDERAVADLGEVQLPRLAVGDLDDGEAEPAEDLEVDAGVAAHVGDRADEEHRHVDAALQQRPRDDEAVAAVVAAAAEDRRRCSSSEIAVHGFDRRHDLAAGVLHQHERRNADVLDRAAIGLAHLRGVEDSHASVSRCIAGVFGVES